MRILFRFVLMSMPLAPGAGANGPRAGADLAVPQARGLQAIAVVLGFPAAFDLTFGFDLQKCGQCSGAQQLFAQKLQRHLDVLFSDVVIPYSLTFFIPSLSPFRKPSKLAPQMSGVLRKNAQRRADSVSVRFSSNFGFFGFRS